MLSTEDRDIKVKVSVDTFVRLKSSIVLSVRPGR